MCPNNPVETVSWNDTQLFLKKLNKRQGNFRYRLPTEAEWDYVARADTERISSSKKESWEAAEYGWYDENSFGQTHPVSLKKSNLFSVYDSKGNVWEWVQDWYEKYSATSQLDPSGPVSGTSKVLRGGSWSTKESLLRADVRSALSSSSYDYDIGFRIVRNAN